MTHTQLLVGIDAGGTHTRAVLAHTDGDLVAHATGGPGNFQRLGAQSLAQLCADLVGQLLTGRSSATRPVALCAGVAGAGRPAEQAELAQRLTAAGLACQVQVVSDARAALEGAHGGGAGIVAIAGTGSIVIGRNRAGEVARAGGWGPVLGDEGSAHGLVLGGVRAVLRARDGWGPATALASTLQTALGLHDWDEVVGAVYGGRLGRDRLAAACPAVFEAARAGDPVATEILEDGARCLGQQAAAVARQLGLRGVVDVACNGGVFQELDYLWTPLHTAAAGARVALRQRTARLPALYGALLLAATTAGLAVPAAAVEEWEATAPP